MEIRGHIGTVRVMNVHDSKVARISVATNYVYTGKDNCPVIETTWHNVTVWGGNSFDDFDSLERGKGIHIVGRLRNQRYTGSDGCERTTTELIATDVKIVED